MAILGDHRRFKKRFVPPMLAAGMNFRFSNWIRGTVPEVLWIGVLIRTLGFRDGVAAAVAIAEEAHDQLGDDTSLPSTSFARTFLALSETQAGEVARRLRSRVDGERALQRLEALFRVYPDYPLVRLASPPVVAEPSDDDLRLLGRVMDGLLDRESPEAARVQATVVCIAGVTGRLRWVKGGPEPPDLEQIKDYPKTEEAREVASDIRAILQILVARPDTPDDSPLPEDWPASFWERGIGIGECE